MRIILPILFSFLIISGDLYAQDLEDSTYSKNKVFLYGSNDGVIAVGKIEEQAVVNLQLMNVSDDRFIIFDKDTDYLFITRYDADIRIAQFDYDYIENEIYPNQQMNLNFYLPQMKGITITEFYYLTYNSGKDTLTLAPTLDKDIEFFIKRFDKREEKKWYKKLGQFILFAIASVVAFRLF